MNLLRICLLGTLAVAPALLSGAAEAATPNPRHHAATRLALAKAATPHVHRAHVVDTVARRQVPPSHRSAAIISRRTASAASHAGGQA